MQHKFVLKEIPLSEIVTGKTNVRVHNVEKDIEELAEHISVNGLLEPIIVFQNKSGKYEILAGQRRFTAIKSLGWDKIWCNLRDAPQDEADAKAISLGENLTQLPMTLEDSIEACTFLFERYGDMKIVAKKHGIIWVISGDSLKRVKVSIGLSNGMQTEVSGEINEGDLVVTDIASADNPDAANVKSPFAPSFPGRGSSGGGRRGN